MNNNTPIISANPFRLIGILIRLFNQSGKNIVDSKKIISSIPNLKPFHCGNIAAGRKGFEVKKTKPKLKPP